MTDRTVRSSSFNLNSFIQGYLLAVFTTVLAVEGGDDIWRWQGGYESSTNFPWTISLIHLILQTFASLPMYLFLTFSSAIIPAAILCFLAEIFTIGSLIYYIIGGILTAILPSLLMLEIVHGLDTTQARIIFVAAHSLYGIVGGSIFWSVMQRRNLEHV